MPIDGDALASFAGRAEVATTPPLPGPQRLHPRIVMATWSMHTDRRRVSSQGADTWMKRRDDPAMLNRQKILIELSLRAAARPVTKIELHEVVFRAKTRDAVRGRTLVLRASSPITTALTRFSLSREAHTLAREGMMMESETTWAPRDGPHDEQKGLPVRIRDDVHRVVRRVCQRPVAEQIVYVYGNFPHFTVNSRRERRALPRQRRFLSPYTRPGTRGCKWTGS